MEQHHITVAHLVEHTHHVALAKGGTLGGLHGRDIRDVAVVAYRIVVDEIAYLLYQTVVAYRDVTQGGVIDARMLGKSFGHLDGLFKQAQTDVAIKYYTMEIIGAEFFSHLNLVPVLSPTAVAFEHANLFLCQLSVISHKNICVWFNYSSIVYRKSLYGYFCTCSSRTFL